MSNADEGSFLTDFHAMLHKQTRSEAYIRFLSRSLLVQLKEMLDKHKQSLDKVFYFDVNDDELVKRVCGRRIHPSSGRSYHVDFAPPKTAGYDDVC